MKNALNLATALIAASAFTAGAQYYVNDFNNLNTELPGGSASVAGNGPVTTYSPAGSGVTYHIYSPDDPSVFGATDGNLNTFAYYSSWSPFDRLGAKVTAGGVIGIGGDFWLDADPPGSSPITPSPLLGISVGLSDGNVVPFVVNGPNDGYWSPSGLTITDLWLSNNSGDNRLYPAMDNLWVAVPEPGVIATNILVAIGALGGMWAYRRRKA